ncbi:translocation/assembly module TamB domain-containing protein [Zhongshania sp.]|uniref:translocation/assembly module TamB domain-containing protein n=1 Tax=Zhongshania sp. TaxID=1971902 RepID=UPI0035689340
MIATIGRYALRTLLALFGLAVLCVASIHLILDTQRGSDWLLHRGLAMLSPEAKFTAYSGSLARGIQLEGLHLPLDGIDIQLGELDSSWNLWGMLSGSLSINKLHFTELTVRISPDESPHPAQPTSSPGPWPSLGLPMPVTIDDVTITRVMLIQGDSIQGESVQKIDRIHLSAALGLTRSKIKTLNIQTSTQQLNLSAKINNAPPYPMNLNVDWATSLEDIGRLSGQAQLSGDLRKLQLQHRLIQPAQLDSQAEISLPYNAQRMSIDYKEIHLDLKNRWQNFKTTALNTTILPLTSTGSLNIEGRWQEYKLNLDSTISAIEMPVAPAASAKKVAQITTTVADKQTTDIANILSTLFKRPLHISTRLSGNELNIAIAKLTAETSAGDLAVAGKVNANYFLDNSPANSRQALNWQLGIEASNIDSSPFIPDWPAQVSAKLSSRGQWQAEHYKTSLDIAALNGNFLGRPLSGSGVIQVDEQSQEFKQLNLSLGDNQVQLHGRLAKTSSLDWQINAQDLGQILPELSGAIVSKGSLRGGPLALLLGPLNNQAINTPQINATVRANKVQYQGYTIGLADLAIHLKADQSFALNITATKLNAGPLNDAKIALLGNGDLDSHTFALNISDRDQQLELHLAGGLGQTTKQSKATAWRGQIKSLALHHPQLGPWQSPRPSSLTLSATEVQLESFCLVQEQEGVPASLCSTFALLNKAIKLDGSLNNLSLDRLSASLPPGSSLQGKVDSEFNVGGRLDQLTGQFALHAEPIVIRYQAGIDEDLLEHHGNLSLGATLEDNKISSHIEFNIAEVGTMSGKLDTGGLEPDSTINGSVSSQFDNLLWLGGFFPELEKLDATLATELVINGTLGSPAFVGDVSVDKLNMQLPAIGLALHSGSATLHLANAGDWQLDAGITSGAGRLKLLGQGAFSPSSGPIGDIDISGENFTAVDLADANVLISPNINVSLAAELIKIRGSLAIPKGNFTLKSLPAQASSVSADEVIISSQHSPTSSASRPIDTQITVTLDDSFQFSGYGLSTRLGGRLRIAQKPQSAVQAFGSLSLYDGVYKAYGQDLSIQRGLLLFQGPLDNPGLNITAIREVESYQVGINIGGFAQDIRSDLFSDPAMPPTDVISMLITGKVPGAMSQSDANQVMNAATSLGISQSKGITNTLQSTFGMDVLNLQGGDSYEESSLVVGKYLTPSIFISYVQNLFTPAGSIQLDYTLSKSLGLKAQSGETQSIDLLYRVEHGKN